MTTILLTGFDPFGGAESNPSWTAVQVAARLWDGPETLHIVRLPTQFAESLLVLREAIERLQPDLVIATGVANGRTAMTPEMVAINLIDARIPDNAGAQPRNLPVVVGGETAYFTTLPVKAMVAAMRGAGAPTTLSYSAGTFVCNTVFYGLMHALATRCPGVRGGFVHVPSSPQEVPDGREPSLPIATMAAALVAGIKACLLVGAEQAEGGLVA